MEEKLRQLKTMRALMDAVKRGQKVIDAHGDAFEIGDGVSVNLDGTLITECYAVIKNSATPLRRHSLSFMDMLEILEKNPKAKAWRKEWETDNDGHTDPEKVAPGAYHIRCAFWRSLVNGEVYVTNLPILQFVFRGSPATRLDYEEYTLAFTPDDFRAKDWIVE